MSFELLTRLGLVSEEAGVHHPSGDPAGDRVRDRWLSIALAVAFEGDPGMLGVLLVENDHAVVGTSLADR
ncbi:hypothetical protein H7H51_28535 [Mycolicibacterium farcinogenes]|nr:hypothetical protein [Mycolicibacterium farcinogenes]